MPLVQPEVGAVGGGGGSPTGSVFKSSGIYAYQEATSKMYSFKLLPTAGSGYVLPLHFSGTSLPSSVVDDDGQNLVRATSTIDATGGMGVAAYYLQTSDVSDSTMTVTVTFAGSTQFWMDVL